MSRTSLTLKTYQMPDFIATSVMLYSNLYLQVFDWSTLLDAAVLFCGTALEELFDRQLEM